MLLTTVLSSLLASYPWLAGGPSSAPTTAVSANTVSARFAPPAGFRRLTAPADSWAAFLRDLPLKPGNPDVQLYDGKVRGDQTGHAAVIDLDVGDKNLQQCADTVLRLRAEYLYSRALDISFHLTNGEMLPWDRYRDGWVATVPTKKIVWRVRMVQEPERVLFAEYLDTLFLYAGTLSLGKDMSETTAPIEIGDVVLQAGSPGHVVIVVDVVENDKGERRFLLAQGYMPAQQAHIVFNPEHPADPWYSAPNGKLVTPDWTFERVRRFRFAAP